MIQEKKLVTRKRRSWIFVWTMVVSGITVLAACRTAHQSSSPEEISLRLIGVKDIAHDLSFKNTTVGGLSGIDYDAAKDIYYAICDDRSQYQPARYYALQIKFNAASVDTVILDNITTLLDETGKPYPSSKQDPKRTPDPEAIRYNPTNQTMVWTSEGERIVTAKDTVLTDPSINIIGTDGRLQKSIVLPEGLRMHATEKGPRRNGVLEGMSFGRNYKTLFVSLEEPRYEDGPQAVLTPNDAWIRIYGFDMASGKNSEQYAYKLDPVAYPATPADAFKINGVPDILYMNKDRMLVMERSFSTGRIPCTIKIYSTNLATAGNIQQVGSLIKEPPAKPLQKKLILNLDNLGIYTDNIEGMTWGPRLPNGNQTLVMVSDNNFSPLERTQLFVFEVLNSK
jgi:hypothetical protein